MLLKNRTNFVLYLLLVAAFLAVGGCTRATPPNAVQRELSPADQSRVVELANMLSTLTGPDGREEARTLANGAVRFSMQLARKYRVSMPPQLHNFLVNIGLREKGLCYHWAEDLKDQLTALRLTRFEFHAAVARRNTLREHSAVVVTGTDREFDDGVVLDAWRNGGELFYIPMRQDSYSWQPWDRPD